MSMPKAQTAVFWFRRDLRLHDNAGLYHALKNQSQVQPVFIFDTDILADLPNRADRRVDFIHQALQHLEGQLHKHGARLAVYSGTPAQAFERILQDFHVKAVYTNTDYEPAALERDMQVQRWLAERGVALHSFKDQVVFEKSEVVKDNGQPYTVFTPYSRKWKSRLNDFFLGAYPVEKYAHHFLQVESGWPGQGIPSLEALGFEKTDLTFTLPVLPQTLVREYHLQRDIPAIKGTTHLGIHLRFGIGSIRALAGQARALNETFLNELIWREFFQMLLWHYPASAQQAFKPAYDAIVWRNNPQEFERWKTGTTGYPLVDAGMRELNATGFMHNRVRMLCASFLCKHLLIDWRWGERYFAGLLLDYDLSANVGNWQWAAGSGADAAPYFRIFNPQLQADKFDPQSTYIRRWVPEVGTTSYPQPMVEHTFARQRCLQAYQTALESNA